MIIMVIRLARNYQDNNHNEMKQTKQNALQVAYNVQRHNNQGIVSLSVNSSESQYEGNGHVQFLSLEEPD